jgi:4-amino-4-deoxy-L-arabinose transferase-like glycosyltransferase
MLGKGGQMKRAIIGFLLGFLSPLIFFVIGDTLVIPLGLAGFYATFLLMAACFFVCQFQLSRGHANALRKDWPIMLALNVVPLLMVIIMAMGGDDLAPGLEVLLACCGGTWAGAFVASLRARSRGKRQVSVSPETGKGLYDREGSR